MNFPPPAPLRRIKSRVRVALSDERHRSASLLSRSTLPSDVVDAAGKLTSLRVSTVPPDGTCTPSQRQLSNLTPRSVQDREVSSMLGQTRPPDRRTATCRVGARTEERERVHHPRGLDTRRVLALDDRQRGSNRDSRHHLLEARGPVDSDLVRCRVGPHSEVQRWLAAGDVRRAALHPAILRARRGGKHHSRTDRITVRYRSDQVHADEVGRNTAPRDVLVLEERARRSSLERLPIRHVDIEIPVVVVVTLTGTVGIPGVVGPGARRNVLEDQVTGVSVQLVRYRRVSRVGARKHGTRRDRAARRCRSRGSPNPSRSCRRRSRSKR